MKQKADFSHVLVEHAEIHRRLENWAQWCRPGRKRDVSPMFVLYRSDNFDRQVRPESKTVDIPGALVLQQRFKELPEKERLAIAWCYCWGGYPGRIKRKLHVNDWGLLDLIHSGRRLLTVGMNV